MSAAGDHDLERLTRILGGAELAPLRKRLRTYYARGHKNPTLTLTRISTAERSVLDGLLGRRARDAGGMRIALADLDHAVTRAGLAASLHHALTLLDGPIPDLLAERADRERIWSIVLEAARDERLHRWLAELAGRRFLRRIANRRPDEARALLVRANAVLACLPANGVPRSQLAAETVGDAHALDKGRPLSALLMAALRAPHETRARETWARYGVMVNELAKPALVLNLQAAPGSPLAPLTAAARSRGEPLHLSLRALLRTPPAWQVRDQNVFVCENANLLAIAADRLGARSRPLICTDGMPSASQRTLLQQLTGEGALLHYHGDFDWPGVSIANYVIRELGARPWRFDAQHYRPKLDTGRRLTGARVQATWDPQLMAAMEAGGYALEEEAVADELLRDLDETV